MNEFYIQRHFKLWEDNNKLLNRIVFLTVVLSLALLIKVLIPFVDFSADKKPVIQSIENLNEEKRAASEKIESINETRRVLEDVNKYISQQPWQNDKQALIRRYQQMNASPPTEGYSRDQYQQEADATINSITQQLHEQISTPLKHSVVGSSVPAADPDRLNTEVETLNRFIDDWKQEYINKNWYRTLERKDRTMFELTASLNERLDDFSSVVTQELQAVKLAKQQADQELQTLSLQIESEADKLKALDDELQKILPDWLRGLIKIEQVIQLLPFALVLAAAFVLILGVSLTRHYTIYTTAKEFGSEITADPGMSSTWTIIHRGVFGSVQTVLAYMLFIVFSWVLFEKSMQLLLDWLSIDPSRAWVSSYQFWSGMLWLSRAGFVILLIFIVSRLRRIIYAHN